MQSKIFIEERIADSKKILHYSNNKFRTFREFNFRERKKERRGWCQFKKKKKSTVHLSTVHILIPSFHPRHAASRTSADRTPDNRSRSGRIKAATQAERAAPKTVAFRCGKNGKGKSIARPRQRRAGAEGRGGGGKGEKGTAASPSWTNSSRHTSDRVPFSPCSTDRAAKANAELQRASIWRICMRVHVRSPCASHAANTAQREAHGNATAMAQLYLLAGATTVANAIKPIGEITALYILSLFPLSMHRASREVLHKLIHAMYRGCVYIYIYVWMLDRRWQFIWGLIDIRMTVLMENFFP